MTPSKVLYLLTRIAKEFDADEKPHEAQAVRAGAAALERQTSDTKIGIAVKHKNVPIVGRRGDQFIGFVDILRQKV